MAIKICIDAGHYGKYNRSPVVPAYYESDMTWALHELLVKELKAYGFEVITTRADKNKDLEVFQRGKLAKGCDLFLSLHSNAYWDKNRVEASEKVNRVVVFRYFDRQDTIDLGQKLSYVIGETMGIQDCRLATRESEEYKGTEYYGVLRGAKYVKCPKAYILEHGFHTHRDTANWLLDKKNLEKLACSEAAIIAEYFGYSKFQDGDVNMDGHVDAFDYAMLKSYILGSTKLSAEQLKQADMNHDGAINAFDYMILKNKVLNN